MSVAQKWFYPHLTLSLLQTKRPPSHSYKQKDHPFTPTNKKTTISLLQTKRPLSHSCKQKDHHLTPTNKTTTRSLRQRKGHPYPLTAAKKDTPPYDPNKEKDTPTISL